MTTVYLVCERAGGHESSSVFSIWTTREAAIREAERLIALDPTYAHHNYDVIQIAEAVLDTPADDADITWVPKDLRRYKAAVAGATE